ncbi:hypothetical protein FS842_002019 [Serendipita sp. 407]|nr:hypothetical protein FRC18_009553 [Serendipita sp. 400]KAG9058058.1 hypothetical protein FS842_002019 [Serendipita sp. 407]
MNAPKLARKRNKSAANMSDLNGESTSSVPMKSPAESSPSSPAFNSPSAAAQGGSVDQFADILSQNVSDLEKLQKIKESILSGQHPFFTSAPKVQHLLSLRVPTSNRSTLDSNASSGSAGDQERPPSSIPLVDRLSSTRVHDDYPVDEDHQQQDGTGMTTQEDKKEDPEASNAGMNTDKTDSRSVTLGWASPDPYKNMEGPDSTPAWGDSKNEGSRPSDNGWPVTPAENADNGWRVSENGRNQHGPHRGAYNHYGNRRFSGNDRQHPDQRHFDNNRNFDRRNEYSSNYPDDRRGDDHRGHRPFNRGGYHQHYGSRPHFDRRNEQGKGPETSQQQNAQPLDSSEPLKSVDEPNSSAMDLVEDSNRPSVEGIAGVDTKMEPLATEPTSPSASIAPPQSATESIATIPAPSSPHRSDVPMDTRSLRSGQGPKSVGNRSPTRNEGFRNVQGRDYDRDVRMRNNQYQPRDNDHRFNQQDGRPRAEGYQKYPPQSRTYDRPLPQRDDRGYAGRDPQHRQSYPPPMPPVDRFVPRDQGYAEEPPAYGPRRDYRPGSGSDWDLRRRDERPIDNRIYDRDRDVRDLRGSAPFPNDSRMQPKLSHMGGSGGPPRGYPPHVDREGAGRGVNPRLPPDPYLSHPQDIRGGYDRAPYPSPHAPPPAGSYSRVRPRSMSPTRRDYRQDERPPNKRLRGPEDSYSALPPSNTYTPHYVQPHRGGPDYQDRRPLGGPSQGGYYRAEDRAPRY